MAAKRILAALAQQEIKMRIQTYTVESDNSGGFIVRSSRGHILPGQLTDAWQEPSYSFEEASVIAAEANADPWNNTPD